MNKMMMQTTGLLFSLLGAVTHVQAATIDAASKEVDSGTGSSTVVAAAADATAAAPVSEWWVYGAMLLGGIALLLTIILAWYIGHQCGKKIGEAKQSLREQKRELQEVQQRLMMAEEKLDRMERQVRDEANKRESNSQAFASRRFEVEGNFRSVQPIAAETPVQPSLSAQLVRKCDEFTQAYIDLQQKSGMEFKMARDEMQRKYGLSGFNCINSAERVNHQDVPPKFKEGESLAEADLWGFRVGTFYVMAPNMRGYTTTSHDNAGMKVLFDSNFRYGNTYDHVKLCRPAIMTGDLQIWKQGELLLS